MFIKSILDLVEIRTKLASIIPFLLGTIYSLYHFERFNAVNFLLMFGSLLVIDMFTTALNNYFDYKRAIKREGYNYERHNAIVKYRLKEVFVLALLAAMLSGAILLGVLLAMRTGTVVLLVGALSFAVGICYSFGPVPISRTPLGEIFSGIFMGFVILFLSVYIHIYDQNVISLSFEGSRLLLDMNMIELVYIALLSPLTVCGIANIMLANNICDIEDDIVNRRYTLPVYIGKKRALWVFKSLYYIAYGDIIILLALGLVPLVCMAALLTFIPVRKNIKLFYTEQTKKSTFVLSVRNLFLMTVPFVLLFWAAWTVGKFIL